MMFRRLISSRFVRSARPFTSGVAYECSPFVASRPELACLERSLIAGCNAVITRSSVDLPRITELLNDLSYAYEDEDEDDEDDNEENLNKLEIQHCFVNNRHLNSTEQLLSWKNDLKVLKSSFSSSIHSNSIDLQGFILQFSNEILRNPVLLQEELQKFQQMIIDYENEEEEENQKKRISMKSIPYGISLTTSQLIDYDMKQIDEVIQSLLSCQIKILHLPINGYIANQSMNLTQKLNSFTKEIEIVGIETLKSSSNPIPGQFSCDYRYHSPHTLRDGVDLSNYKKELSETKSDSERNALEKVLISSVDFHYAIDRSIQVEKVLLEKLRDKLESLPGVTAPQVCLGHVLVGSHEQFTSPEHWDFVCSTQIDPLQEKIFDAARTKDPALADWVSLFQPVVRNLQSSFRTHLQLKSHLEVIPILEQYENIFQIPIEQKPKTDRTDFVLASVAKRALDLKTVGLTLSNVNVEEGNPLAMLNDGHDERLPKPFAPEFEKFYSTWNNNN